MEIWAQLALAVAMQDNNERKHTTLWRLHQAFYYLSEQTCLFLEDYVTSDGAVSHNNLYYQQLSITRHQVSCYADNDILSKHQ